MNNPIIIGGCGRSGTTLLASVLSSHPDIYVIPEETYKLCPEGYGFGQYNGVEDLLDRLPDPEPEYWVEKTPKNIVFVSRILKDLPNSKFIHMVRDGRDVITSKHPQAPNRFWVSPERWVHDVSWGRYYLNKYEGWMVEVRYEDLVTDYEETLRDLLWVCDIPWNDALLDYPESAEYTEDKAWFESARPITDKSVGRYKEHPERTEELIDIPDAVALLKHYGYLT